MGWTGRNQRVGILGEARNCWVGFHRGESSYRFPSQDCSDTRVQTPKSLDSFKWYKAVYEYSRPGNADTQIEERDLGPDGDLVSSMVSTTMIPRLCRLIEGGAFDVYSARHVRRMIDLAEEVEASVEDGNAKLQVLALDANQT